MDLPLFRILALGGYLAATAAYGVHLMTLRERAHRIAMACLLTAFAAHAAVIVERLVAGGAAAAAGEGLSLFAWLVVGAYLAVQTRVRLPAVGAVVAPLAFSLTAAALAIGSGPRELPPQLESLWLPIHVTLAFLGNAVLALAAAVSLVYLIHERELKEKRLGRRWKRLPSLETLDHLNYRALLWGFLLLTLGIVSGALWGKHSWGRFWSWDEREVFSLVTWILYAGLLEARMVAGLRGRRAATVTIVGFAAVLVSFMVAHSVMPGERGVD
jgi:cytochrome c-type biogenesis protein CcsB